MSFNPGQPRDAQGRWVGVGGFRGLFRARLSAATRQAREDLAQQRALPYLRGEKLRYWSSPQMVRQHGSGPQAPDLAYREELDYQRRSILRIDPQSERYSVNEVDRQRVKRKGHLVREKTVVDARGRQRTKKLRFPEERLPPGWTEQDIGKRRDPVEATPIRKAKPGRARQRLIGT